jgi:glycosyltransferase involved in cell wall biosynthesis
VKILVLARLTPAKVRDHLLPLLIRDEVSQLTIVRENPVPLDSDKVRNLTYTLNKEGQEPRSNSFKTVWGFIKMAGLAAGTIRREKTEVIYGLYLIPYGLLAWGLAKLFRRKSLISLIGTDLNKDVLEYWYAPILRWFLRRTDVVTVFDEAARQKLIALNFDPTKVFVLPHGVEVQRFDRIPNLAQDIDVIFVGYLWALKEVGRLLKAWQYVIQQKPDARLAIVGDGPQREELESLARQLGITDSVTFAGVVDNVPYWISRAKVFVNLANQEGVPMAMIEAMIGGLVPVVTAVGGVPSVVRNGENGFLVDNPADPTLVAERILAVLNDENLYASLQHNALSIRDKHSYTAVSDWWESILKNLHNA